ncbi:Leucine-rich repeat typical subtype [Penicillium chermesinum]|nr:Leucine-rich repeat typical subtype [Penicillium chermesinum]
MDNEVPLPPPRRIRHRSPSRARLPSAGSGASFRPRLPRFDDQSSQPSSDPALFSSDDIPASGLENYNALSPMGRGANVDIVGPEKRHLDSGVWMGSDESGADSLLSLRWAGMGGGSAEDYLHIETPRKGPPYYQAPDEPEEHRIARSTVHNCLEKGEETIDLGNLNLRNIPTGLLRPLQHLTKAPVVREAPISEDAYTSLQPFLSIYLPGNSLMFLPTEIFELKDLKVLSVRNNKLRELPSAIRKLTSLEVLNIAVNQLSELPWDLMRLMQAGELKHFTAHPNPFPSIEHAEIVKWHREPCRKEDGVAIDSIPFDHYKIAPLDAWSPVHVATGPVTQLDLEGRRIESSSASVSGHSKSAAPSLRELALRAVSKLPELDLLTDEELEEYPALLIPLMRQVKKIRASGSQQCSVCRREFIMPRTEWIEWWDCVPHENGMKRPRTSGEKLRPLPFKRLGCSWACIPEC